MKENLLTMEDVASELGVSRRTVERMIADGHSLFVQYIPPILIGRCKRFSRAGLERFRAEQKIDRCAMAGA